jgi:beta-lactam-binding protein with PASTA domain
MERAQIPRHVPALFSRQNVQCWTSIAGGSVLQNDTNVRYVKSILWIAAVAGVGAFSAAAAATSHAPNACVVPRLVGSTIPAAKARLTTAGCRLGGIAFQQPHARVVRVTSQVPAAGAVLPTLTRVVLGVG